MSGFDRDQLTGGAGQGRYGASEVATFTAPDGRQLSYRRRRFLPHGASSSLLVEIIVEQGDRLDLIAMRHLGDSGQAFRICDANDTMNPFDLTTEPGIQLRIPIPSFETDT